MILVAHPFGNANVRAVLGACHESGLLARYLTTLGWPNKARFLSAVPGRLRRSLMRRSYDLPKEKIRAYPAREGVRLLARGAGTRVLTKHERGWASIDRVWQELDQTSAGYLRANKEKDKIRAVYAYEDCALRLFETAVELGVRRVYDLPIAYWETARRLLKEEAERYPEWEPTLGGSRDSDAKLARKTRELELAELVICPSNFVADSLPPNVRNSKPCLVVPFGSPSPGPEGPRGSRGKGPLRVLFAGSLTQRKGLADLFAAMKLLGSSAIELVVMGSLVRPLRWYREQCGNFTYEAPRPHADVLRLMRTCDVFVLPSLVEGRALVQQLSLIHI